MDRSIPQHRVEPFIASVENLFRMMLKQKVEAGAARLGPSGLTGSHVRATIGLSGDVIGSVSLLMPEDASIQAVADFVGKRVPFGSEDFCDAVGELSNMITGGAVCRIPDRSIGIGCPVVVMASLTPELRAAAAAPSVETAFHLPFTTASGSFVIELRMTDLRGAANAA